MSIYCYLLDLFQVARFFVPVEVFEKIACPCVLAREAASPGLETSDLCQLREIDSGWRLLARRSGINSFALKWIPRRRYGSRELREL